MKNTLYLCFLLSTLCFSAAAQTNLTDIRLPNPAVDRLPAAVGMYNTNFNVLSNAVANGTGGSGAGFFITQTNGTGTNLIIWQPLTVANETMRTWVEWTNPPPAAPWWTNSCSNLAGPYYDAGNGTFTNACGFSIDFGGGTNEAIVDTNAANLGPQYIPATAMAYGVTVSHTDSGLTGTYYWTNGAFWKDTNTESDKVLYFANAANTWTIRNAGTYYNNYAGSNFLGTWGGGTFSVTSTNTNGFARGYWPVYEVAISGMSGPVNANGLYRFHDRDDNSPAGADAGQGNFNFTNETGCSLTVIGRTTTNVSTTVNTYAQTSIAGVKIYVGATAAAVRQWVNVPPYTLQWNTYNGYSGSPAITFLPHPEYYTNTIVIVESLGSGTNAFVTPGTPPMLKYSTGGSCTYLSTYPTYSSLVDVYNQIYCSTPWTNCSNIYLNSSGTAFIVLAGGVWKTIPQSNSEWRTCP